MRAESRPCPLSQFSTCPEQRRADTAPTVVAAHEQPPIERDVIRHGFGVAETHYVAIEPRGKQRLRRGLAERSDPRFHAGAHFLRQLFVGRRVRRGGIFDAVPTGVFFVLFPPAPIWLVATEYEVGKERRIRHGLLFNREFVGSFELAEGLQIPRQQHHLAGCPVAALVETAQ